MELTLFAYLGWSCRLRFVGGARLRVLPLRSPRDGVLDNGAARTEMHNRSRATRNRILNLSTPENCALYRRSLEGFHGSATDYVVRCLLAHVWAARILLPACHPLVAVRRVSSNRLRCAALNTLLSWSLLMGGALSYSFNPSVVVSRGIVCSLPRNKTPRYVQLLIAANLTPTAQAN